MNAELVVHGNQSESDLVMAWCIAAPIVVSQTATDLMIGNTVVEFTALGSREFKGLSGQWPLYQADL